MKLRINTIRRKSFIMCIIFLSVLILFLSLKMTLVGPFSSVHNKKFIDSSNNIYAIIFDAGSTGTRIHVFNFLNSGNGLILTDEYFQEVRPGLSSYSENPSEAGANITLLLDKAVQIVPSDKWHHTPLLLKATAGLRLLPVHLAKNILKQVEILLRKYPFQIKNDSVSIMDGTDEGLYAWFTINFLLGLLENKKSVATLDLGGGSTQVTFAPNDLSTFMFSPKKYIIKRMIQDKSTIIYTHSYLGLGLMTARLGIMKLTSYNNNDDDNKILSSPCIHSSIRKKWTYGNDTYLIKGMISGKYKFETCYEQAVMFLNTKVNKPKELTKQNIYALSYYFDTAVDMGIIDKHLGNITITVSEYQKAVKRVCTEANMKLPFLCLDGTYIVSLLCHGLGLDLQTEFNLVKKINGVETSWGLGAAYSSLS